MPSFRLIKIALLALALSPISPQAGDRVAFVVGNDTYPGNEVLKNCVRDATAVRDLLDTKLGFPATNIVYGANLTAAEFFENFESFKRLSEGADIALIYFAGHGMEARDGRETYLIPTDADLEGSAESEAILRTSGIRLSEILEDLGESTTGAKIVLLDCCRNRPRNRSVNVSGLPGGGLAALPDDRLPSDTFILLAAAPNREASDGRTHGPFTKAILEVFPQPGKSMFDAFFEVSDLVQKETHKEQVPWLKFDGSGSKFRANVFVNGTLLSPVAEPKSSHAIQTRPATEFVKEKAFGDQLAALLSRKDFLTVNGFFDRDTYLDKVFKDIPEWPEAVELRTAMETELKTTWLLSEVNFSGPVKCLGCQEFEGHQTILLRVLPNSGGVAYISVAIATRDGGFRIYDLNERSIGLWLSEQSRTIALMTTLSTDQALDPSSMPPGLTAADRNAFLEIMNDKNAANHKEVVSRYSKLPLEAKNSPQLFYWYLLSIIAQKLEASNPEAQEAYIVALRNARVILPGCLPEMLEIDLHLNQKSFGECVSSIDRVHNKLGLPDPYLDVLKGLVSLAQGNYSEALRLADSALLCEPDLFNAIDLKIIVFSKTGEFVKIVDELRVLKDITGVVMLEKELAAPVYTQFLNSPQFEEWKRENQ
jgi:Caspase domain